MLSAEPAAPEAPGPLAECAELEAPPPPRALPSGAKERGADAEPAAMLAVCGELAFAAPAALAAAAAEAAAAAPASGVGEATASWEAAGAWALPEALEPEPSEPAGAMGAAVFVESGAGLCAAEPLPSA